jgi:SAM-dependent methyltransferase
MNSIPGLPTNIKPDSSKTRLYEGLEYKEFWEDLARSKLDELEHIIIRDLLPASGHRIIDLGCGFGRLADCYLDRFEEVVLVDGSMSLLKQAREFVGDRATYIAVDANHMPFRASSFDCVLMVRVFHHIHDSASILKNLKNILTNKGILLFNYCNKLSARQLFRWFLHKSSNNPFTLEPDVDVRFITHHPNFVSRLLYENGFCNMRYLGIGVMDKIAGLAGRFHNLIPNGRRIAPLLGVIKLAPWVFCRAIADSESEKMNVVELERILMCPLCRGDLKLSSYSYICLSCDQDYPIVDGIADFRLNF